MCQKCNLIGENGVVLKIAVVAVLVNLPSITFHVRCDQRIAGRYKMKQFQQAW